MGAYRTGDWDQLGDRLLEKDLVNVVQKGAGRISVTGRQPPITNRQVELVIQRQHHTEAALTTTKLQQHERSYRLADSKHQLDTEHLKCVQVLQTTYRIS